MRDCSFSETYPREGKLERCASLKLRGATKMIDSQNSAHHIETLWRAKIGNLETFLNLYNLHETVMNCHEPPEPPLNSLKDGQGYSLQIHMHRPGLMDDRMARF